MLYFILSMEDKLNMTTEEVKEEKNPSESQTPHYLYGLLFLLFFILLIPFVFTNFKAIYNKDLKNISKTITGIKTEIQDLNTKYVKMSEKIINNATTTTTTVIIKETQAQYIQKDTSQNVLTGLNRDINSNTLLSSVSNVPPPLFDVSSSKITYQYIPVSNGSSVGGATGATGASGADGVGIASIATTSTSTIFTLTNGSTTLVSSLEGATSSDFIYATATNFISSNANITNFTNQNATSDILFATSSNFVNATSSNLFTYIFRALTSYFTDIFTINLNASNTITNNLISASSTLNGTTTIATASIGNFYQLLQNFTTNLFSSATNTIYSTVNGVATSTNIINANTISFATATSILTSSINGIISTTSLSFSVPTSSSGGLYYKESTVAPTTAPTATGVKAVAIGDGAQASGQSSSAFGYGSIASGTNSLAIGYMNIAREEESYVFGRNNEASWYAMAVGAYNYALGTDSFAFGNFNTASAINSSAFGYDNDSSGYYSMSFGYSNDTLGMYSSSFGRSNISSGLYSNAFGLSNTASGTASMSFGYLNVATGDSSIAFGYVNNSSGEVSSAFGAQNFATAYHSSAFGYFNSAAATNSSAFGFTNTASASGASAFGSNITNNITNSTMIGPSNTAKLTILSSGFMGIGTTTPTNRLTIYAASADTSGLRLERLKPSSAVATTTATKMLTVDTNGDVVLTSLNGSSWTLTGNSGTNANTSFIGTTDAIDLNFRVNNISNGSLQGVSKNTLFGESAGRSLASTTASKYNVGIGYQAFGTTTVSNTGTNNVAIGRLSSFDNTSGSNNVAIGYQAGNVITTGSNNLTLGNNAQVPTSTASNQIRLGDTAITYAGIQVAWTITSDSRLKENINTIPLGLSFLNTLRPVEYHRINNINPEKEFGFIAQELEQSLASSSFSGSGLVNTDSNGMKSVRYNDLFSPIVKAIQELDAKVTNNTLSTTTITNLLALASTTNLIGGNVAYATDIDMQNYSILNVKAISNSNGKWSISEEGRIVAREVCLTDDIGTVCVNASDLRQKSMGTSIDNVVNVVISTSTATTTSSTTTISTIESCALTNQILDITVIPNMCIASVSDQVLITP